MPNAAEISKGDTHKIIELAPSPFREKLLEMGCTPGTKITKIHQAPFGCPIAFDVEGYQLALRKSEAKTILLA